MKEKRLVMYMHAGSGNHGCEAIVNSTCHMIKEKPVLLSYYGREDERYSLKDLCDIRGERSFADHKLVHVWYYLYRKLTGDEESFVRYRYGKTFREDIPLAISIGGDNYCYDNMLKDLRLANQAFVKKGTRTVLLGCSIEPELIKRPAIAADLMKYHTIIARESITFEALQRMVAQQQARLKEMRSCERARYNVPKVYCFPDPAFTLQKKELPLPAGFQEGNTIGINISPMIQDKEESAGITMKNYQALIRYIIENTGFQIALIPHVIWDRNDDRKPIHALYEQFKDSGRILELPDGTCEELKGYIARCRMFIGARTHATIAAYSSLVPTLVVGYSVKARGIARDLFGTEKNYVLPVQLLEKEGDLTEAFKWLAAQEETIREQLAAKMPAYQEAARQTGKEVDHLWEECSQQQRI